MTAVSTTAASAAPAPPAPGGSPRSSTKASQPGPSPTERARTEITVTLTASTLLVDIDVPTSPALLRALLLDRPEVDGVELLLWPEAEPRRRELEVLDHPCLLILDEGTPAPVCGALEDWVRPPTPMGDVEARCAALRARATCAARPVVVDGALSFGRHRVELSDRQVLLARLLVDRYREVVRRDELAAAGGGLTDDALKAALARLAARLEPAGLTVRTIRGVGNLLEPESGCGSQHPDVANASAAHR